MSELQRDYGVEDLYDLLEIIQIDTENRRIIAALDKK